MSCFFGCFRAVKKQHHLPPPSTTTTAAVRKTCKEADSSKHPSQPCTPAKLRDQKELDSLDGTPTSCICDPSNAGRVLVDTTDEENQSGSLQKHMNRRRSAQENLKVEGSLSSWLKPVQHNAGVERGRTGRYPGDIPILGTVAAYWNDDMRPPENPLKWWDGNGIPNSTTKYGEDQKVKWHATPFEVRLEKALSEEKSMSQRKHIKTAHMTFQDDELDIAASSFRSLPQPKSVISC